MINDYLLNPLFTLSLILTFFTFCNGQVKTDTTLKKISEQHNIKIGTPKLVNTQGPKESCALYCGMQDKNGDIWFGTLDEGVYRYDGKLFYQYTVQDGLSSNDVHSIIEDKTGNIWFGTGEGACRYDGKTFTTIPIATSNNTSLYSNNSTNNASMQNEIWSIMQDKNGKIWIGTTAGVYCYDGKTFSRFLDDSSIINKSGLTLKYSNSIIQDRSGNIWFTTLGAYEGFCRFDKKNLINFPNVHKDRCDHAYEDREGNIWIGAGYSGAIRYDGKTFAKVSVDAGIKIWVNNVLQDSSGNIWFSSEKETNDAEGGGLFRYDGKTFTKFTTKDGLADGTYTHLLLADKSGNLWIGSAKTGLSRYNGKTFTNF